MVLCFNWFLVYWQWPSWLMWQIKDWYIKDTIFEDTNFKKKHWLYWLNCLNHSYKGPSSGIKLLIKWLRIHWWLESSFQWTRQCMVPSKRQYVLIQKPQLNSIIFTAAKDQSLRLTVKKAILHGVLPCPSLGQLTTSEFWPPAVTLTGGSPLLTLFQTVIILFFIVMP